VRGRLDDLGLGRMLGIRLGSDTSQLLPGHNQHVNRITVGNTGSYAFC
jgi:hypothetical protein